MQPYLFPYIGYFQLIRAVDRFVLYDDVNYIKGGWINRNRILINGRPRLFTLSLSGASPNKLINQLHMFNSDKDGRGRVLNLIRESYQKAPQYRSAYPIIEQIMSVDTNNLSQLIEVSVKTIAVYLGINTPIVAASAIPYDRTLKGEERLISLCRAIRASTYINSIGGAELYHKDVFAAHGIALYFLKTKAIEYYQGGGAFVPNLSIIDILMFNTTDDIADILGTYELV